MRNESLKYISNIVRLEQSLHSVCIYLPDYIDVV